MKRQKRVELYLLFEVFKPSEILRLWPQYSQGTVYKYYREWKQAKKKVRELIHMLKGG